MWAPASEMVRQTAFVHSRALERATCCFCLPYNSARQPTVDQTIMPLGRPSGDAPAAEREKHRICILLSPFLNYQGCSELLTRCSSDLDFFFKKRIVHRFKKIYQLTLFPLRNLKGSCAFWFLQGLWHSSAGKEIPESLEVGNCEMILEGLIVSVTGRSPANQQWCLHLPDILRKYL